MSIFGWSYPPGCSGPPDESDRPCEICGLFPDDCICPECPRCGAVGDPLCYWRHGLIRSQEQIGSLAEREARWRAENEAEARWAQWASEQQQLEPDYEGNLRDLLVLRGRFMLDVILPDTHQNRHLFSHFRCHCTQCIGYGWVEPDPDADCVHDFASELSVKECRECSIYHAGR